LPAMYAAWFRVKREDGGAIAAGATRNPVLAGSS
jgi:hypothetical protein